MSEHKWREKQLKSFIAERDAVMRDPTPEKALAIWNKRELAGDLKTIQQESRDSYDVKKA